MAVRIGLGVFLLFIAALDVWAARDIAALQSNPGAAWIVRLVGPSRAQPLLLVIAAFLALLGIATILMAVRGIVP